MKKIICILITLSILCISVFASVSFTDTADSNFKSEIEQLKTLGILNGYQDATFKPEANLTRAEFAKIIADMFNFDSENLVEAENLFSDISKNDWSAPAIGYVKSMGFMNGYPDGKFKPNNNLTVQEAQMALINVLGYGHEAKDYALAPVAAKRIGLTKGLESISPSSFITRECVAKMVVNALGIDLLEITGFGETQKMEVVEGVTLLSRYHDIIKGKGKVEANEIIAVSGEVSSEDTIRIGEVEIEFDDYSIRGYVGLEVDYMYKYDDETQINKLIYIGATEKNRVVTVDLDDYISFESNVFEYYDEKGNVRKLTLSASADVFKNDEFYSYTGNPFEKIKEGEVKFISNSNGSVYDVAFITEFRTYIAESVNKDTKIIRNKLDESDNLDLSDEDILVKIFDASGKEIGLSDVKQGDVITAKLGREVIELYISRESVSGITKKTKDAVEINGVEYKLSENVKFKYSDLKEADNSAEFFLDCKGEIAYYENAFEGEIIYLLKVGKDAGGMKGAVMGRFFSINDGLINYKFEENVIFNGSKINWTEEAAIKALESYIGSGDVERMVLVKYNDEGNIYSIDTPKTYKECMETGTEAFCEVHGFDDKALWYSVNASTSFEFKLLTDRNSTQVMVIPFDIDKAKDKDFKVVLASTLSGTYSVGAYNKGTDYGICDMIAVKSAGVSEKISSDHFKPVAIIKSLETTMNEDGELVKRAYCVQGKNEISFDWKEDDPVLHVEDTNKFSQKPDKTEKNEVGKGQVTSNDLEVGDIIQYITNDNGELTTFEVYYYYDAANCKYVKNPYLYDYASTNEGAKQAYEDMKSSTYTVLTYATTVEKFDGKNIFFYHPPIKAGDAIDNGITVSGEETYDYRGVYFQTGFEAVHIVEIEEGKDPVVYAGTVADIQVGDEIIIQNIWTQTMSGTIIRRK